MVWVEKMTFLKKMSLKDCLESHDDKRVEDVGILQSSKTSDSSRTLDTTEAEAEAAEEALVAATAAAIAALRQYASTCDRGLAFSLLTLRRTTTTLLSLTPLRASTTSTALPRRTTA